MLSFQVGHLPEYLSTCEAEGFHRARFVHHGIGPGIHSFGWKVQADGAFQAVGQKVPFDTCA